MRWCFLSISGRVLGAMLSRPGGPLGILWTCALYLSPKNAVLYFALRKNIGRSAWRHELRWGNVALRLRCLERLAYWFSTLNCDVLGGERTSRIFSLAPIFAGRAFTALFCLDIYGPVGRVHTGHRYNRGKLAAAKQAKHKWHTLISITDVHQSNKCQRKS
jgi:hypothetical protein